MDLSTYSFYLKPRPPRDDILFRVLVNVVAAILLIALYYLSLNCSDTSWVVRDDVTSKQFNATDFHTGDILLVFKQGHDFIFFPGHMAIVVELPRYGQKYVWDLPVPIKYSPNVLKPLGSYIKNSLKGRESLVYVHHLTDVCGRYMNPKQLLPEIKKMSASIHYKLQTAHDHANFCAHSILGFPGIPDFLPKINEEDLHYCSSATIALLIKAGVIKKSLLEYLPTYCREQTEWYGSSGTTLYPQMFIHPDWELSKYVKENWHYSQLYQIK